MFTDTLVRWLEGLSDVRDKGFIQACFSPLFDRQTSLCISSAGLDIKAGGSALVKSGASATLLLANGRLQSIASATDMAALAGTVAADAFNVYCFFCDGGGTLTTLMGTAGASLAAVKFPQLPLGKAMIGFVIINPTGTGDFVGGTTPLDDATVVPNAVYVNAQAGFDPNCLTGLVST